MGLLEKRSGEGDERQGMRRWMQEGLWQKRSGEGGEEAGGNCGERELRRGNCEERDVGGNVGKRSCDEG